MSRAPGSFWLLPADILSTLAERVRLARVDARLTQQELAERAGVSPLTIHKLEAGRNVSMETFLSVMLALGRLDDLQHVLAPRDLQSLDDLRHREVLREKSAASRRRVRK
ncbi:MAG: helix-turn-helix domain-containing protein [Phycisphaeraceae bacterium]|nr:helix-turn-helix domain-containing protein [Phycisphaeraceae bacterium]